MCQNGFHINSGQVSAGTATVCVCKREKERGREHEVLLRPGKREIKRKKECGKIEGKRKTDGTDGS